MPPLQLTPLFELTVPLAPPLDLGGTPEGRRVIYPVASGRFAGARIAGHVVPMSGADWSRIRADGTGALDVRLTLRTDDGALILMTYGGRLAAAPEDLEYALDIAKPDAPETASRYYLRINPLFETGDERYAWLNRIVAVGTGRTGGGGVAYEVYEVR